MGRLLFQMLEASKEALALQPRAGPAAWGLHWSTMQENYETLISLGKFTEELWAIGVCLIMGRTKGPPNLVLCCQQWPVRESSSPQAEQEGNSLPRLSVPRTQYSKIRCLWSWRFHIAFKDCSFDRPVCHDFVSVGSWETCGPDHAVSVWMWPTVSWVITYPNAHVAAW